MYGRFLRWLIPIRHKSHGSHPSHVLPTTKNRFQPSRSLAPLHFPIAPKGIGLVNQPTLVGAERQPIKPKAKPKQRAQKTKTTNRKSSRRLMLSSAVAEREPWTIPTRWLNAIIAIFLFPVAGILSWTFFSAFSRSTQDGFWASEEFWFFGLGGVLWTLWFYGSIWALGEPRPLRVYVFGHELTHAIWVWLMGGRVRQFRVSRDGGHILTDTHNFWIALAPYFYPVYSIALIVVYGVVSFFYQMNETHVAILWVTPLQWLFLALGATWAFHFTFTCWMIPKGQSDLTYHGTFFSLVIIYIMNVVVLSAFLVIAAPEVSCRSFFRELLENTEDFSVAVRSLLNGWLGSANSF